ncbi:hypothetical protein DL768_004942 [Monosporascus sp. mg162]|nr:hypothetical protein DL768_004942 [Monosporascus sp. mg162]
MRGRARAAALCADAHGAADGLYANRDATETSTSASVMMLASRMLPSTSPAPGTATAVGAGVEGLMAVEGPYDSLLGSRTVLRQGGTEVVASDQAEDSDAKDGEEGGYEHEL